MAPGGSDEIENPGETADLRLDTGLALWTFSAVPVGQAASLAFGPRPDQMTLTTSKGGSRQFSARMQSLLPDENSGPVCMLDQFRPGMSMKHVCALLDKRPLMTATTPCSPASTLPVIDLAVPPFATGGKKRTTGNRSGGS